MPCKNSRCLGMGWRPDCLLFQIRSKILHHWVTVIILCKAFIRAKFLQKLNWVWDEVTSFRVELKISNIIISILSSLIFWLWQVMLLMCPLTCYLGHGLFITKSCCHWSPFWLLTHNGHIVCWADFHNDNFFLEFVCSVLMPYSTYWQLWKCWRINRFNHVVTKRNGEWYDFWRNDSVNYRIKKVGSYV